MAEIRWIEYKGKRILYFGHSGLQGEALINSWNDATQYVIKQNLNNLLTLADFSGCVADSNFIQFIKSDKAALENMKKYKKSAVIGISGIKKIFLNTFNAISNIKSRAFSSEQEAKEYLVQD